MSALHLTINGESREVEVDDDTPLLWILRDSLGLTGTKFGCGVGVCGAFVRPMGPRDHSLPLGRRSHAL
jgi:isoquinoline 1-oxidoreductase subunit alpha